MSTEGGASGITAEDSLRIAQQALARVSELEERVSKTERQQSDMGEEMTAVNLRISAFDEDRPYKDLSLEDKVGRVREVAFRRAADGRGRRLDYKGIRDVVFDGDPSPGHCYKLMKLAGEARGFEHRENSKRNEHLYVDPEEARRSYEFSSANKTDIEEGQ